MRASGPRREQAPPASAWLVAPMSAVAALDGPAEADMVRSLMAVRANLLEGRGSAGRMSDVGAVKDEALRAVNEYFEGRLRAVPSIREYLEALIQTESPA